MDNPYYEPYSKRIGEHEWICGNEECESLNMLPKIECRRCGMINDCALETVRNSKQYAQYARKQSILKKEVRLFG